MPDDTAAARARRATTRRRVLGAAGSLVVVVAVFVFLLPRIADYREVLGVVRDLGPWQWVALAAATLLNLATFAPPWMAALPGLRFRQAFVMTQTSTALATIAPAGAAVGMAGSYTMLRSWSFPSAAVGLAVALTGVWNQLANLAFPIVALALLTAQGQDHPALRTAALVGVAVLAVVLVSFAVALSSPRQARRVGDLAARLASRAKRIVRRPPVPWDGERFVRFRAQAVHLVRRRWHVLTLATLLGHLTVFVVLLACLRAVGVSGDEVSGVEAFAAWALVRILGALPLTPAGVGVIELGLTGALVAFGAPNAEAVAATLLYRALTVLPTLALGLLGAATWRTHHPGRDLRPSPAPEPGEDSSGVS